MRVALVGPYPSDGKTVEGGVEMSFVALVEGLGSLGDVEPHVITFARGHTETKREQHGSAQVTYLPGRERFNNLTLFRDDRRALGLELDRLGPDIVHAQDSVGYGYVTLKEADPARVVVSVHGIAREELRFRAGWRAKAKASIAEVAVQRYCIRRARFVIEPTRYPEQYFGSEMRGRVFDVGNPIAESFFGTTADPEPGRLLAAGIVTPLKRMHDLLDVLATARRDTPDATLRIAGPTPDPAYVEQLRERAARLGVEERVTLLGSLSPAELLEEYRRAAVFVTASGQENSPMVIGEAMAVGVPVVATRVGGVPYLVAEGQTGLLAEVGDVDRLAAHVSTLLADEPRRRLLGAEGRTVADQRFRSGVVARRVRDVYRTMLAGREIPVAELS
jgi:glycosyltransferase involved in cell wall biosynthesis